MLRLKNPCVDPEFVNILPEVPQLTTITYKIGDPEGLYDGVSFQITASKAVLQICGNLALKAEFDGVDITNESNPLSYDPASNTFAIFTEDNQYVQMPGSSNMYPYTLIACLANYPDGI